MKAALILACVLMKHWGYYLSPDDLTRREIFYVFGNLATGLLIGSAGIWYARNRVKTLEDRAVVIGLMYFAFEDLQCFACGSADVIPTEWSGMCLAAYGPAPYLLAGAIALIYLGWASRVRTEQ